MSSVTKSLTQDPNGAWSLGADGVLRSFANGLTVLDYRQLDPEQVKNLASSHIKVYQAIGGEVPSSLEDLVKSSVDGRTVTDVAQIFHPQEKPNIPAVSIEGRSPVGRSPLEKRQGDLVDMFRDQCNIYICQRLRPDCPPGCNACYFPNGPPWGTCYT